MYIYLKTPNLLKFHSYKYLIKMLLAHKGNKLKEGIICINVNINSSLGVYREIAEWRV